MHVIGNPKWLTAISFIAISVLLPPFLAQDTEPLRCPHINATQELTVAVMKNRIAEMKSELELTDQQVAKLSVAIKRITRDQSSPIYDLSELENHKYIRGNPLTSEFWQSTREKVLTAEQQTNLTEYDCAVEARSLATAINSKEALESPVEMTKFFLTRWKRDARLSELQMERIKPLLENYLGREDVNKMEPKGFVSDLEKAEVLTKSQLLLFKAQLPVGHGPVWKEQWMQANCADCHKN